MKIELVKSVNKEEFIRLYREAGWWSEEYTDTSFIDHIVADSFLFAAVFDDTGRLTGMGRALSDGCSDAYIQDVVVLKACRGQGIGKAIINFLVGELKKSNVDWIGLIGEPGTKQFYESLGFKEMQDYIPMKFNE